MHWIYPSVGGAFFGFGLGAISDEALTLVIDCYAGVSVFDGDGTNSANHRMLGDWRSLHCYRIRSELRKHSNLLCTGPMAKSPRLAKLLHCYRCVVFGRRFSASATNCLREEDSCSHGSSIHALGRNAELDSVLRCRRWKEALVVPWERQKGIRPWLLFGSSRSSSEATGGREQDNHHRCSQ